MPINAKFPIYVQLGKASALWPGFPLVSAPTPETQAVGLRCRIPAGPAGDPSLHTRTLPLELLVPGGRDTAAAPASSPLLAGTGAFLAVQSSCIFPDEFLPDKRISCLPRLNLLLLFIAHLKSSCWPYCPSKSSQSCSHCSGKRDGVSA